MLRSAKRMGVGLLVVLAAVWMAVLLPSLVRSRIASSPIDGVRNFEVAMGILAGNRPRRGNAGGSGRWVMVPREVTMPARRRSRVIQRRRRIFNRLVGIALVTLATAFVPAVRWMVFVHLFVDAVLGLYVWRLIQIKNQPLESPAAAAFGSASSAPATTSQPPLPHAEPAYVASDDPIAALISRTG